MSAVAILHACLRQIVKLTTGVTPVLDASPAVLLRAKDPDRFLMGDLSSIGLGSGRRGAALGWGQYC
jgi:hypothetical protein